MREIVMGRGHRKLQIGSSHGGCILFVYNSAHDTARAIRKTGSHELEGMRITTGSHQTRHRGVPNSCFPQSHCRLVCRLVCLAACILLKSKTSQGRAGWWRGASRAPLAFERRL
jgi:hypothetical protein